MDPKHHTVSAYDEDLDHLGTIVSRMGGLAETQLKAAVDALFNRDSESAQALIENDQQIDDLEAEADEFAVRLLALRQPVADDLRRVIAALKIAADIERIGDYAKNIAKRTIALEAVEEVQMRQRLRNFGIMVLAHTKQVLDAYAQVDAELAMKVRDGDVQLDDAHNEISDELQRAMVADPSRIPVCTHLLFVAKNLERIGDLATNVAESIHFVSRGKPPSDERPKGDTTSETLVDTDADNGQVVK